MQRPNGSKDVRSILWEVWSSGKFLEVFSCHPNLVATKMGRLVES